MVKKRFFRKDDENIAITISEDENGYPVISITTKVYKHPIELSVDSAHSLHVELNGNSAYVHGRQGVYMEIDDDPSGDPSGELEKPLEVIFCEGEPVLWGEGRHQNQCILLKKEA